MGAVFSALRERRSEFKKTRVCLAHWTSRRARFARASFAPVADSFKARQLFLRKLTASSGERASSPRTCHGTCDISDARASPKSELSSAGVRETKEGGTRETPSAQAASGKRAWERLGRRRPCSSEVRTDDYWPRNAPPHTKGKGAEEKLPQQQQASFILSGPGEKLVELE